MHVKKLALILLAPSLTVSATELSKDHAALRAKIMEETKVVAVMDIDGPSTSFKNDGDPATLEVVFLSKRSDGPSRVSQDGQVVFLYKASDELQSELIGKAFDLRVAKAIGGL
jgi:hypothetical protein